MRPLFEVDIPISDRTGVLIASVRIVPLRPDGESNAPSLVRMSSDEAKAYGESEVQLLEGERYEYEVVGESRNDVRLSTSLAMRRTMLRSSTACDAGIIETGDYCGTLQLALVIHGLDAPLGVAFVEVRTRKLDYRSEYRGMLTALSERLSALVIDARSSVKTNLRSNLDRPVSPGNLQVQLELLRDTIEGSEFSAAIERIAAFTHERMEETREVRRTSAPGRWTPRSIRKLTGPGPKRSLAATHPIAQHQGIRSVVDRIEMPSRSATLDTPENRFVKFVLVEWRELLKRSVAALEGVRSWEPALRAAQRLDATLAVVLQRTMSRDVGELRALPLGSPVLQRKAGYREIYRWWLRSHAAADLAWDAGEELFRAGERRVATLYEYWLFFELLEWFSRTCLSGSRPPLEKLVDGLEDGEFRLRLKRGRQLGPFEGEYMRNGRRLKARFSYNKRFAFVEDRTRSGSWTRALLPDYTLTFWPVGLSEEEAEESELIVHVHFDAKYRVESAEQLFGSGDDDGSDDLGAAYRRADLLKMHAYRDAIRRSQGAFVLYPGRGVEPTLFRGFFHEILPGLGAFGIAPDAQGKALGLDALAEFLDDVLGHLSNRTTAQERISYHVGRSYLLREAPVDYGAISMAERDTFDREAVAVPPAEQLVLVINAESAVSVWTREIGLGVVCLASDQSDTRFNGYLGQIRHVLFRSRTTGAILDRLFEVTRPGFSVVSRGELVAMRFPGSVRSGAYALFRVREATSWAGETLDSQCVERAASRSSIRNGTEQRWDESIITMRDLLESRQR